MTFNRGQANVKMCSLTSLVLPEWNLQAKKSLILWQSEERNFPSGHSAFLRSPPFLPLPKVHFSLNHFIKLVRVTEGLIYIRIVYKLFLLAATK